MRRYTENLNIPLTKKQKAELKKEAQERGIPLSELVREKLGK